MQECFFTSRKRRQTVSRPFSRGVVFEFFNTICTHKTYFVRVTLNAVFYDSCVGNQTIFSQFLVNKKLSIIYFYNRCKRCLFTSFFLKAGHAYCASSKMNMFDMPTCFCVPFQHNDLSETHSGSDDFCPAFWGNRIKSVYYSHRLV